MKTHLMYIDKFPFRDKKVVYTDNHEKIMRNLNSFPDILEMIEETKLTEKPRLITVFNCSNYIVALNVDLTLTKKSFMHFFEKNFNIPKLFMLPPMRKLFSPQEMQSIVDYQKKIRDNPQVTHSENVTFIADN